MHRAAMITLGLLALSAAAVGALVRWKWPESSGDWVTVVAGVGVAPTLYMGWVGVRAALSTSPAGAPETLEQVADQLAAAVHAQWVAEVALRRLNDPYALPVRWEAAPTDLVEDWSVLTRLATSDGAGWPAPPATGAWASRPEELAGTGGQLAEVLGRIPTGRLVLLGEPGAGKTILLARLAVDLLPAGRRAPEQPVPVLLPLASWDPRRQSMEDWVHARLVADYPGLGERAPDGSGKTRARRLWETGLLLLLLDGLDEITNSARGGALAEINDAIRPGQRLVLTCRIGPYRVTVHPPGGVEVRLTGAAGIHLCPLQRADMAAYLRDSAGRGAAAARWDPVLAALTPASPVGQALTSPLMASLARTVYNPRPNEPATTVDRSPTELLDPTRFPTCTAVEQHLFDGYLPAAYRPHRNPSHRSRWNPNDAERWLTFLARHLDHTCDGTPNLAWWQLDRAISPHRPWLRVYAVGLAVGFPVGYGIMRAIGLIAGSLAGLAAGSIVGIIAGIVVGHAEPTPRRAVRWRSAVGRRTPAMLMLMLQAYMLIIVVYWRVFSSFLLVKMQLLGVFMLISMFMFMFMLMALLVLGLSATPADLTQAASPALTLRQDRAAFGSYVLAAVLASMLALGPAIAVTIAIRSQDEPLSVTILAAGLVIGSMIGLVIGLVGGLAQAPWGMFVLARSWLAARGDLRCDLMVFLDDAHRRGVLRQSGAVYQFRHLELQHHLARR